MANSNKTSNKTPTSQPDDTNLPDPSELQPIPEDANTEAPAPEWWIFNLSKDARHNSKTFKDQGLGEEYLIKDGHERTSSNIPNTPVYIHNETGDLLTIQPVTK